MEGDSGETFKKRRGRINTWFGKGVLIAGRQA